MNEVRIRKTIKFGHGDLQRIYTEGEVLSPPLPPEILQELKLRTGTVVEIGKEPIPDLMPKSVRQTFVPEFRGKDYVTTKRPAAPQVATSATKGAVVPKLKLGAKKPLIVKREVAAESEQKEIGPSKEKPKVKLSLRNRTAS